MSIQYIAGDMIDSAAEALVNFVSMKGPLEPDGSANMIFDQYPEAREAFDEFVKQGELAEGIWVPYRFKAGAGYIRVGVHFCTVDYLDDLWIINLPIVYDGHSVSIRTIRIALIELADFCRWRQFKNVALPFPADGFAAVNRDEVEVLVDEYLGHEQTFFEVYVGKVQEQSDQ